MPIYIEELIKDLYINIKKQINLSNELQDYRKGSLVIKKRNNLNYYYLSYRTKDKVKSDYLGKLSLEDVEKIQRELNEASLIREKLKNLQNEEQEIRRIIKAVDKKALIKDKYEIIDIIAIIRPILKEFGVKEAYIYGSYAEGNATELSDINFEIDKCNKTIKELIFKLQKATNKQVDVIEFVTEMPIDVRQRIDDQKILIYDGY